MPIMSLKNVKKVYTSGNNSCEVLKGISLDLESGTTALLGPSGAGKSTLLAIMGLLDKPTEGSIIFRGNDVSNLSPSARASTRLKEIGFVFQEFNLIGELTAWENIALPAVGLGSSFKEYKERALELLERVGCSSLSERLPSELSGGQIQRIAVARALLLQPKLVLADEPTGNLDSKNAHQIIKLLSQSIDSDTSLFVVTHDQELASLMDRQICIEDGMIKDHHLSNDSRDSEEE